jgi:hypothetical protein
LQKRQPEKEQEVKKKEAVKTTKSLPKQGQNTTEVVIDRF